MCKNDRVLVRYKTFVLRMTIAKPGEELKLRELNYCVTTSAPITGLLAPVKRTKNNEIIIYLPWSKIRSINFKEMLL